METTFDELVTKHTRRELEEMALSHGVQNLGGTKSQLAEAILEAIKKQEATKPSAPEKPKEVRMAEKLKANVAEPKPQRKKSGVMSKVSSTQSFSADIQKAGREMRDEGIRRRSKGIREFHSARDKMTVDMQSGARSMLDDAIKRRNSGLEAFGDSLNLQIKENRESAAKFNSASGQMRADMQRMAEEFQRAGKDIRSEGSRNLQRGLNQFGINVSSQIKANRKACNRIHSGASELQSRARSLQSDIQLYRNQDLSNYIRDFYYG
ncbi:MAG: hypothetical protein HPY61_12120 [Methanotrichaceae archaeon]|nr:hypothetical protein [Methanotrichaceae archaeon]